MRSSTTLGTVASDPAAVDEYMKAGHILSIRQLAGRLTHGDRSGAIHSVLRRLFSRARGSVDIDDFDGALSVRLNLAEHMQRRIFWKGYYNDRLVPVLDRLLLAGDTVLDVGANVGEVSLLSARRVGPSGRVIAFEPVDAIADALQANVDRNHLPQVEVHRLGLGDVAGSFDLYASYGHAPGAELNLGMGSLHGDPSVDRRIQSVEVRPLDVLVPSLALQRIDFLKVDIEGAELACLRGAAETIVRFRPVIAVEVQIQSAAAAGHDGAELLGYLEELGYGFYRLGERGRLESLDASVLEAHQDVVCIHVDGPADVRARLTGLM